MKLISYNVNGIRAVYKKGLLDYIKANDPDILCLQETKAQREQLSEEILHIPGYESFFAAAEKKGYSGVAIYAKKPPLSVDYAFSGDEEFAKEGRVVMAHYKKTSVIAVYFPNGSASDIRLAYKLGFYDACLADILLMRKDGREIILCGDFNTAHAPIDLARPKQNEKNSGFLPVERAWMTRLEEAGFIDTFRHLHPEERAYTWWDMKTRSKARDVGWRLDYFYVSEGLKGAIQTAGMQREEALSDHCPIYLTLQGDILS